MIAPPHQRDKDNLYEAGFSDIFEIIKLERLADELKAYKERR